MAMANMKIVVCVEDEPEMIMLIKAILNRKGYDVMGAANGREGLETIERVKPDLVLLDLMMPGMDGWEVYQKLKANEATQAIPVIIVTAKAQSIDKMLGLHIAKVDDYIAKPFSPQELVESIEKVLAKKLAASGEAPAA
jgi:two-component system response regulator VicR